MSKNLNKKKRLHEINVFVINIKVEHLNCDKYTCVNTFLNTINVIPEKRFLIKTKRKRYMLISIKY